MMEHSGRYAEWGKFLAENGFTVLAIDHRGHGRSDGKRLGIDRFSDYVDDFEAFIRAGAAEYSDRPVFLAGMSMGGGIAVQTTVRIQETVPNFRGTVLIAPGLGVDPRVFPVLRHFVPILDRLCPDLRVVKPRVGGLSRDPVVRDDFLRDPDAYHGRIPVHFGAENFKVLRRYQEIAPKIKVPIFIAQGNGDRIVDVTSVIRFFDRVPVKGKELKIYPGLYHDLLHEPEKDEVYRDILDWLNYHL